MTIGLGMIGLGEVGHFHLANIGIPKAVKETGGAFGTWVAQARKNPAMAAKQLAWHVVHGRGQTATVEPGLPGTRLVAVSDVDQRRIQEVTDRYEVPFTTTDYKALIARPDVDAVLVCTPPVTHAEIVAEAARHGKHVFCEKPLARTSADCNRIIEATERANVLLQVGYMLRFTSERGRIVQAIQNNEIGRPVFYREFMNMRAGGPQQWIHDMEQGGGVIFEMSHLVDFYRHIFGDPEVVYAIGGRYKPNKVTALDTYAVSLSFASGDKVLLSDSYALKDFGYQHVACRRHRQEIDVIGPAGYIQFPDADLSWNLTICQYSDQGDRIQKTLWSNEWGVEVTSYRKELEHFVQCVQQKKRPAVPGIEGLRTVQLAETIVRSIETGQPCKFPPADAGSMLGSSRKLAAV